MDVPDSDPTVDRGSPGAGLAITESDVMAAIADVASTHLRWDGPIAADLPLVEALALDSLRQLTFIVELENRFRIRFDQDDESSIATVGDLTTLIRRKLAQPTSDAR